MKLLVDISEEELKNVRSYLSNNAPISINAQIERISNGVPIKWFSVNEKLPEDFEQVLCWYEYYRYGNYNRMYKTYGIGFYDSHTKIWGGDVTGHKLNVIAWMPLPEPYKE